MRESEKLLTNNFKKEGKFSEKSFFSLKKVFSIYFRILMNYVQMTAIIQSFDLKWPFYVNDYLSVSSKVGSTTQMISFDCLLKDNNIQEKTIHIKSLVAVFFPFLILASIIFGLIILKLLTKKSQTQRIFISFIVMSIFLQPSILQILFDNLNSTTLNNVSYLTKDLTTRYDDDSHMKWV